MSSDPIASRLAAALEFVHEAGSLTLRYFQSADVAVERKADHSPVTQADREAELLLRERISHSFPTDAIQGEEFPRRDGTSEFTWVLDPIDGTKSFITGVPLYSQLIGILRRDESVAGVINIPALEECVYAASGQGAWSRTRGAPARRARVSECRQLADGIFLTSQVDCFLRRGAMSAFEQLQERAYVTRTWGDGYGYLLVATGRAEVMIDPVMHFWDAAPLQVILEEAGGAFTDWQGTPTIGSGEGVGTNRHLLHEVLAITRQFPRPTGASAAFGA